MSLKSLKEHECAYEKSASDTVFLHPKIRFNGIACPSCGQELVDNDPTTTLLGMPPRKAITCPKCNFTGTRRV
jgi:predicted RNA-binding Zn-ribbon protein involved in translation (DUF1610 family)